tara:strand:+ start:5733 stop:6047 length:315 start_codon:yes stop_codon:yes gene_type:complete
MSNRAIPLNIKNVNSSGMSLKWHNKWAAVLLVLFMSATWLTAMVVRENTLHPIILSEAMLSDLEALGPWAFLLDGLFLFLVFVWLRRRKATKMDNKWESSFPLE